MTADLGIVGLGVMGAALARNFRSRGLRVAVYDRDPDRARRLAAEGEGIRACYAPSELVGALGRPRRVLVMVPSGAPITAVLEEFAPLLEPEDIFVDGGNSHYEATERRAEEAARRGFRFVGMGVSGGERGALLGPAMMPGGDREAYEALRPLLEAVCARSARGPCVAWCGRGSAGHFVKMVHNGIEYADMQAIAEGVLLLRTGLGMPSRAAAEVFEGWNAGPLRSFLVEITAGILAVRDPQGDGPLVDAILDVAGQKGTGRWTSVAALTAGTAIPSITAAVDARVLSADRPLRLEVARRTEPHGRTLRGVSSRDIESALLCTRIAAYAQGFGMLRAASEERGYGTDLAETARIWMAGCIIRAALLERIHDALLAPEPPRSLVLVPALLGDLRAHLPGWRRVVAQAALAGLPVPVLSSSLSWFDGLRTARGTASVIQAQRDWFGAHTYRRADAPEVPVHTDWEAAERW